MTVVSLRKRCMAGKPVLGAMIFEFFTPGIAQIVKNAGAEFIIAAPGQSMYSWRDGNRSANRE